MKKRGSSRITVQNDLLDLSMSELTEIPVKDIAGYPKATRIDLSCNRISFINPSFCNFRQLVELDLSQNNIQLLPENFGNLSNLTKLDLYNNQLSSLPISFASLTKLRYLDLKNNRFPPNLTSVVGECSEAKECQQCARQVVSYMQQAQKRLQEEIAKRQLEEEKEARRQEALQKELEQSKKAKKATKDKRNNTNSIERLEKSKQNQTSQIPTSVNANATAYIPNVSAKKQTIALKKIPEKKRSTFGKFMKGLLYALILTTVFSLLTIGAAFYIYTGGDFSKAKMTNAYELLTRDFNHIVETIRWNTVTASEKLLSGWNEVQQWYQNSAFPTTSTCWKVIKETAEDVRQVLYLSFRHVTEAFHAVYLGGEQKVTATISSGQVLKY